MIGAKTSERRTTDFIVFANWRKKLNNCLLTKIIFCFGVMLLIIHMVFITMQSTFNSDKCLLLEIVHVLGEYLQRIFLKNVQESWACGCIYFFMFFSAEMESFWTAEDYHYTFILPLFYTHMTNEYKWDHVKSRRVW